jgi:hypothetical protein
MFQELNSAIDSRSRREYNVFAKGDTAGGREEGVGGVGKGGSKLSSEQLARSCLSIDRDESCVDRESRDSTQDMLNNDCWISVLESSFPQ